MIGGILVSLFGGVVLAVLPSSTNYKLQTYGVNSGGTNSSTSSTYSLQGAAGETSTPFTTGPTYQVSSSSIQAEQASVPPAPTVDNGSGTNYNKLTVFLNSSANPSDATYAIQESTISNFSSFNYVQADGSLGSSIVWRTYTNWGGFNGMLVTGLSPNTTYYFRVAAQTGKFTASAFGPSGSNNTVNPSLTFSVSPSSISLGTLTSGSIITNSSISFTFTTNAANGGIIYMQGSDTGLKSPSNSNYIIKVAQPSGDLASLTEGFGFQGSAASPMAVSSPYNSTGTAVGAIYTSFQPLFTSSAPVSFSPVVLSGTVAAKSGITTPPGTDYADTLTFVASASY